MLRTSSICEARERCAKPHEHQNERPIDVIKPSQYCHCRNSSGGCDPSFQRASLITAYGSRKVFLEPLFLTLQLLQNPAQPFSLADRTPSLQFSMVSCRALLPSSQSACRSARNGAVSLRDSCSWAIAYCASRWIANHSSEVRLSDTRSTRAPSRQKILDAECVSASTS